MRKSNRNALLRNYVARSHLYEVQTMFRKLNLLPNSYITYVINIIKMHFGNSPFVSLQVMFKGPLSNIPQPEVF
jgi:hypothetical protein